MRHLFFRRFTTIPAPDDGLSPADRFRIIMADTTDSVPVPAAAPCAPAVPPPDPRGEQPGPDGIRWGLVNRMRALIAAGKLDTPPRWAVAEDLLVRAAAAGPPPRG